MQGKYNLKFISISTLSYQCEKTVQTRLIKENNVLNIFYLPKQSYSVYNK